TPRGIYCEDGGISQSWPKIFLLLDFGSEKPAHSQIDYAGVDAQVGRIQASVGNVQKAILQTQCQTVAEEIVGASAGLKVVFESGAQIQTPNAGGGDAGARIDKRNPSPAGSKVITQE